MRVSELRVKPRGGSAASITRRSERFKKSDFRKMDVFNRLKSAVTNVLPGNPLARDFDIQAQVASAGPRCLWKVFAAVKRSTKEEASVFLFEKKSLDRFQVCWTGEGGVGDIR